jgi:hypothetical protein
MIFKQKKLFDKNEDMIERIGGGKGVLAVVAFDFRTRLIGNSWRQHRSAAWLELQNRDHERQIYRAFYEAFVAVLPNTE